MEVIEDYEAYPEWADVRTVDVRERGEGGRATEVAFEVDVPVLGKARYTLAYQYAPGDTGLSWVTTEARGADPRHPRRVPARRGRGRTRRSPTGSGSSSACWCRGSCDRGREASDRERAREAQAPRRDGLSRATGGSDRRHPLVSWPHARRAVHRQGRRRQDDRRGGDRGAGGRGGRADARDVDRPRALARRLVRGGDRLAAHRDRRRTCGPSRSTRRIGSRTTGARSRTTSSS